jgi:tetratricopeptide (TPR) repeat protein
MRHLVLLMVLLAACEDWQQQLAAIRKMEKSKALDRVEELEKQLTGKDDAESLQRHAELLIIAKMPHVPMMAKGGAAMKAIGLLEEALKKEPDRHYARYLMARTCLGLPAFFGKQEQGVKALEELVAVSRRRPGSMPWPDVFLRLAKARPNSADQVLQAGLRAFPDDPRLKQALKRAVVVVVPHDAERRLIEALESGKLENYPELDAALAAAQKQRPKEARLPLLRGLLRLWRLERTPDGQAASEAMELFALARKLDPDDTRIYGWLGPLLFITGRSAGLKELEARGRKEMDEGARINPEQNLFGRALALRRLGIEPERVAEDLYRTVELCTGGKMDRTRFLVPKPTTNHHPACRDPKSAPHNRAGTLFWAGEFFREQKATRKAIDAFEAALALDAKWPYRALAQERLAILRDEAERALTPAPTSCALCHRK